jgi:cytochrome c553
MKYVRLKLAMLTLLLSPVAASAGEVETFNAGSDIAKSKCNWCHGSQGQGIPSTAPQLAGQHAEYLRKQLLGFQGHVQDGPFSQQYMWGVAANLRPEEMRELGVYFANLDTAPAADGNKELFEAGERIYQQGIPASNIPSCVPCHGLKAEGAGAIPRMGGQSYNYLKTRLRQWAEGYSPATEPPMPEIASKLSPDEINALASYLSFIR